MKPAADTADVQVNFLHDVFVSYSRRDKDFTRRLTDTLRNYQPPRDLKVLQRRLSVFRDEEDFTGVEYHAAVARHLKNSARLILICSPHSRQSQYVNDEIRRFAEMRGADNIIPVLILGVPNNEASAEQKDDMAFPDALCEILQMPLAVDYRGFNPKKDKVNRGVYYASWFALLGNIYGISRDLIEQREKKRETRRRRITRGIVGLVMATLLTATVVSLIFWRQAVEQRNIALARQLAAQAELTRSQNRNLIERSVLLAAESIKRTPTLEADLVLRPQLGLLMRPGPVIADSGDVYDVAFSPDRKYVAVETGKNVVGVWEVSTGRSVAVLPAVPPVAAMTFSPDGAALATGSGSIAGPRNYVAQIWNLTDGREVAHLPHEEPVRLLDFSADGRYLATGDEKDARVWDASTGQEVATITHDRALLFIKLSPDGERLATETNRKVNRIWNIRDRKPFSGITLEPGMYNVAFSPDWKRVATATTDGITIQDAATGRELVRIVEAGTEKPRFVSNGAWLIAAGRNKTTIVWNAENGEELMRLAGVHDVTDAAVSPDGQYLATYNSEDIVRVWSVGGLEVSRLYVPLATAVGFSADGGRLATVSVRDGLRMWEMTGSSEVARLRHEGVVSAVLFSPDGKSMVTNSDDRSLRVWDIGSEREIARIETKYGVRSLAIGPVTGEMLAIAISDGDTRLVETLTGRLIKRFDMTEGVNELLFSRDEKHVVTAGLDNIARIWEVPSGREVAHMSHDDGIAAIALSPDEKYLATSTINSDIMVVWDAMTGREVARIKEKGSLVRLTFSSEGSYLAGASPQIDNGVAILWEPVTGREVRRVKHEGVTSLAFSPDGKLLATAGPDVRIWKVQNGDAVARLPHRDEVTTVMFSADSTRVMTGSADGAARVWAAATGREIARMQLPGPVLAIAVSPDEKCLATASNDVRTWFLRPSDLLAETCRRLTRNLTREEWGQFVGAEPYSATCPNLPAAQ